MAWKLPFLVVFGVLSLVGAAPNPDQRTDNVSIQKTWASWIATKNDTTKCMLVEVAQLSELALSNHVPHCDTVCPFIVLSLWGLAVATYSVEFFECGYLFSEFVHEAFPDDPRFNSIHSKITMLLNGVEQHQQLEDIEQFVQGISPILDHTAWLPMLTASVGSYLHRIVEEPGYVAKGAENHSHVVEFARGVFEGMDVAFDEPCVKSVGLALQVTVDKVYDKTVLSDWKNMAITLSIVTKLCFFDLVVRGTEWIHLGPGYDRVDKVLAALRMALKNPAELPSLVKKGLERHTFDIAMEGISGVWAFNSSDWRHMGAEIGKFLVVMVDVDTTSTSTGPPDTRVLV